MQRSTAMFFFYFSSAHSSLDKQYHWRCIGNFQTKENPINIEFAAAQKFIIPGKSCHFVVIFFSLILYSFFSSSQSMFCHISRKKKFQFAVTVFNRIFHEYIRCVESMVESQKAIWRKSNSNNVITDKTSHSSILSLYASNSTPLLQTKCNTWNCFWFHSRRQIYVSIFILYKKIFIKRNMNINVCQREGEREKEEDCDRTLEKMMMKMKSVIEAALDGCVCFCFRHFALCLSEANLILSTYIITGTNILLNAKCVRNTKLSQRNEKDFTKKKSKINIAPWFVVTNPMNIWI